MLHVVFYDDDLNPAHSAIERVSKLQRLSYVLASIFRCILRGNRLTVEYGSSSRTARAPRSRTVNFQGGVDIGLKPAPIDFDQLCYEEMIEGLGYSQNRTLFRELAQRVPYPLISIHDPLTIQAILLGTARLLEIDPSHLPAADQQHVSQLIALWQSLSRRLIKCRKPVVSGSTPC